MVNLTVDQLMEVIEGRKLSCWEQYVQGEQASGGERRDSTKRIIATAHLLAASGYWPTPGDEEYILGVRVPRQVVSMSAKEVQACLVASEEGSEMDRLTIEWNKRLAEASLSGRKMVWTDVLFPEARAILATIADHISSLAESEREQQPIITGLSNIQVPHSASKALDLNRT